MENIAIQMTKLKGKGVFAIKEYSQGDLIEKCPAVLISFAEADIVDRTKLGHYWFSWNENCLEEYGAFVGGFGMFYNHSQNANAIHLPDFDSQVLNIIALRNIRCGEEITLHYNTIWFESVED